MKIKTASVLIFLFFVAFNSLTQESKDEGTTFNKEMAIGIGQDSIAVYALVAAGVEAKETVILLHGIPGNERNLDLAQDLRKAGKNVIFFSYRGAWGSQGTYSYANCLADISFVLDHFSDTAIVNEMHIDTTNFTLIGHSLGGGLALLEGANDNRVKTIIAISAANYGYRLKEVTSADSLMGFQNYIASSFMLHCNPTEFVQEILDHKADYDPINFSKELKSKKVLILDDFDRSDDWPGKLKNIAQYKVIESDHSFTNKRKELSAYIIKWLNED